MDFLRSSTLRMLQSTPRSLFCCGSNNSGNRTCEMIPIVEFKKNNASKLFDLENQGNPSRSGNRKWIFWDHRHWECYNQHQDRVNGRHTKPDISKVIWKMCMFNVRRSRYVNYFNSFDISDLEIVRIDTKIMPTCMRFTTRDTKGHTQMC